MVVVVPSRVVGVPFRRRRAVPSSSSSSSSSSRGVFATTPRQGVRSGAAEDVPSPRQEDSRASFWSSG